MNDHELDLALRAIGGDRTRVSVPPSLRARVHAVPLGATGDRGYLPHITWRFLDMFSATRIVVGGAIAALVGGALLASSVTSPAPSVPGGAPSASPIPAIHWTTPVVDLSADAFSVEANDIVFTYEDGTPQSVGSDPGGPDRWTLEIVWTEHDREQRLNMYFAADETDWWVDEIRTYDGYEQGEWIYAYGPFFKTTLGEAFEGDVRIDLLGEGRPGDETNRVPGVLTIEGMRLTPTPRMLEDIAALPPDGGVAVKRDPFGKGGPLQGSGILKLPPAKALERLLDEGYRVAFRLDPYPGDDFDPTVPPEGVIQHTAVDSYGNVLLFVTAPEVVLSPAPETSKAMEDVRATLMAECLDEGEATQLIASTLGDLGVTDLTIATDGPVAYPVGERDAYVQHTDQGCYVYGGRQWNAAAGQLVYYIGGPGSVDGLGTPSPSPAPAGDQNDETGDLHVSDQTTLAVEVFVDGERVAAVSPHSDLAIDRADLPDLPWLVDVRTEGGRSLLGLTVSPEDVTTVSDPGGPIRMTGAAARVDLSCGRLDVWAGPPLAGPVPGPGTPGDCAP